MAPRKITIDKIRSDYLLVIGYAIAFFAIAVGVYARVKGLGAWSFADDEYHTAQSIQNILLHGVPAFECGGYYSRGLGFQYLQAAALQVTSLGDELTLRLVTAVLSLLAIPALFQLSKKLGATSVALAATILFSVSIWEIETARYLRMYGPFQSLFLWYVLILYRVTIENDNNGYKWLYGLSLASLLVWEGGIVLVLLNFLPFVFGKQKLSARNLVIPITIITLAYTYLSQDFRRWGIENPLPPDVTLQTPLTDVLFGPIILPKVFVSALPGTPVWFMLSGVVALLLVASTAYVIKTDELLLRTKTVMILWLVMAFLNLYGLIIYSALILWLVGWLSEQELRSRAFRMCVGLIAATLIFWSVYGLTTTNWHSLFPEVVDPARKVLVMFFKYPDTYAKILYMWAIGQPFTTIALGSLILLGLSLQLRLRGMITDGERLLLIILIALGLVVAALKQPYDSAHYTFFLYPVVFLLGLASMRHIANFVSRHEVQRVAVFAGMLITYVVVADDYNLHHVINVDSKEINFRTIYDRDREYHLWNREDYKTPARFINDRLKPEDIVVATVLPVHYYLERIDYQYINATDQVFRAVSACGGSKEIWSNAALIYRENAFFDLLQNSKVPIWLIVRSDRFPWRNNTEIKVAEEFIGKRVYRGMGQKIDVYRISGP